MQMVGIIIQLLSVCLLSFDPSISTHCRRCCYYHCRCDGSYLEDQDKWWLSGIYREVTVTRRPVSFICDFEFASILHHCTAGASSSSSTTADVAKISVTVLAEGVSTAAIKAPSSGIVLCTTEHQEAFHLSTYFCMHSH